jgi:hypothetical protein
MQSRNLKIESTGDYFAGKVKPQIRLKGYWLEQAGFEPGNHVAVYFIWPGLLALRVLEKGVEHNSIHVRGEMAANQIGRHQKQIPTDQIRATARLRRLAVDSFWFVTQGCARDSLRLGYIDVAPLGLLICCRTDSLGWLVWFAYFVVNQNLKSFRVFYQKREFPGHADAA